VPHRADRRARQDRHRIDPRTGALTVPGAAWRIVALALWRRNCRHYIKLVQGESGQGRAHDTGHHGGARTRAEIPRLPERHGGPELRITV